MHNNYYSDPVDYCAVGNEEYDGVFSDKHTDFSVSDAQRYARYANLKIKYV